VSGRNSSASSGGDALMCEARIVLAVAGVGCGEGIRPGISTFRC
jgi:hypothetical protein